MNGEEEGRAAERAARILDAAAELIAHYGYDKTTVSDIAQAAGISKGAVYLHWKSKDELMEALVWREGLNYLEAWADRVDTDPDGDTFYGIYRLGLLLLAESPFLLALVGQNRRMMGAYVRRKPQMMQQRRAIWQGFLQMLQQIGAVRQDVDPALAAYVINVMSYGFLKMDEITSPQETPPANEVIGLMADMLGRAFTPEDGGRRPAIREMVRQMVHMARQQAPYGG